MWRFRRRIVFWGTPRVLWKWAVLFLFCICFTFILLNKFPLWATTSFKSPLHGLIVVIDSGHGGPDGGATSKDGTVVEEDINLAIGMQLRDFLQEGGAIVVMTRDEDEDLADSSAKRRKKQDLHRREALVKNANADLFISIHMNAMISSRWSGAQTFYDPRSHPGSEQLALWLQHELRKNLENTTREAKTIESVYLLKTAEIPSALIEVGFLSNPEEARLLATEDYQRKVAASIYYGILRFVSGETIS